MAKKEYSSIKIEGLKDVRKRLRATGDDLHELRDLHRDIAKRIATEAKARAPVGATGNLRKSVRGSGSKTMATVRMGNKRVPYANAIHWGRRMWPSLTAEPKPPRRPFWAPIPRRAFIYDTIQENARRVEKQYEEFIQRVLAENER